MARVIKSWRVARVGAAERAGRPGEYAYSPLDVASRVVCTFSDRAERALVTRSGRHTTHCADLPRTRLAFCREYPGSGQHNGGEASAMGGKPSATEGKPAQREGRSAQRRGSQRNGRGRSAQRRGSPPQTEGARPAPVRTRRPASATGCSVRACLTQLPSDAAMQAGNPRDQTNMRMHPREAASRVACATGAWRREACGLRARA